MVLLILSNWAFRFMIRYQMFSFLIIQKDMKVNTEIICLKGKDYFQLAKFWKMCWRN